MRLLCALGLFLALLHVTSCLLIGAFNIRTFGVTKSGIKESKTHKEEYEEAMKTITKIVRRYDIILIQEVLDPDGKVTDKLLDLVNEGSPQFRNISSVYLPVPQSSHKRAKREGYKERYLFLYNDETVTETGSFQYDGGKRGVFERPPFVVKFSSRQTDVEFVLIPIHTKPGHAVEELKALVDVVDAAKLKWTNNKNIMVLGDFNAGGTYVKGNDLKVIRPLFTNKGFHWLINDNVDTTVLRLQFAYDRIVVSDEMNKGVVNGTAGIYDFNIDGKLTPAQELAVSNHFPVQVQLDLKLLENHNKRYRESDDLSET